MLKYLLLVWGFLGYFSVVAQQDTLTQHIESDSLVRLRYVENVKYYIRVYAYSSRFSNGILYNGNSRLSYYPITPVNIGIGLAHKWLGGSVSVVSIQSNKSKFIDNYNFNIQLNAHGRKVGAEINYTLNSGYYQTKYKDFAPYEYANTDQPFLNMRMQRLTFNFVRVFNSKKYSLNALINQGEIQKKSASSLLLNMGFSTAFAENGDSLFVPSYLQGLFEGNTLLKKGTFYSLGIMPGYGFTWVVKEKFFLGVVPSLGMSLQYQHLDFLEGQEDRLRVSYKALGRFGLGYHVHRWMFGLSAIFDVEHYPLGNDTYLLNNVGRMYARIGYRLDAPKWIRKYSDRMDKYQEKIERAFPKY